MNLQEHYQQNVIPQLLAEMGTDNRMTAPKLMKVVINIGLKEAITDKGVLEKAKSQLGEIAGQLPKITRAKKSIANFKLRQGDAVGLTVTLRGKRMYDFVTKLVNIVLPRVRDFQGVSVTAFDQKGNYTLGLAEQIVFPEIDYSKVDKIRGLEITFVINNSNVKLRTLPAAGASGSQHISLLAEQARYKMSRRLLELLGMPFKKEAK